MGEMSRQIEILEEEKRSKKGVKGRGGEDEENPKLWLVELESVEEKRKVMRLKKQLKGRRERIEEDNTNREREREREELVG